MTTGQVKILDPGVHRGVPAEVYHAQPYASNSRLQRLKRSPAHLAAYVAEPGDSTTALRIGRAAHTSILEPHRFDVEYVTASTCTGTKKDGEPCSFAGSVLTESGWRCGTHVKGTAPILEPRVVMKPDDLVACRGMRAAVHAHPLAANLVRAAADVELTLIWDDPETGVRCKARPDLYAPDVLGGAFGDLKTTDDARAESFSRSALSYGYFAQAAHYLDGAAVLGLAVEKFAFFAVEKSAPHGVVVYEPDADALLMARTENHALLKTWATCAALNEWPSYAATAQILTLPAWAYGRALYEPLTPEEATA